MTITQAFKDIPIGHKCTGTVAFFNLNGPQLVRSRMLAVEGHDYILVNRHPRDAPKDMDREQE